MGYYLAIDIGASGGRHILGRLENGKLVLEEIYRFRNVMAERDGSLCWDAEALFAELQTGIRLCEGMGKPPVSVGVDTWGVDFVLLDPSGKAAGPAVAYRDGRTEGMDAEVEKRVPYAEHYARTGTRKEPFNTVYQLMSLKLNSPELLERADCMLLMPDYMHYRLTGEKRAEATVASTTGLLGAQTRDWDWEIIDRLGFPRRIFPPVAQGAVPSHDTASAFLSVPAGDENAVYISSGTWSLLGVMTGSPVVTGAAREAGFTNEGGYGGRNRLLKTIMGMWMIRSVRNELPDKPSYDELVRLARESGYGGVVAVNDPAFYAPESMSCAVRQKCVEAGYPPPGTPGDTLRCVCVSLAREYARGIRELETLTGEKYTSVNIIGGGSRNGLINQLTANASGLPVYAGPAEGTALGNILSQMLQSGELPDMQTARGIVRNSFEIKEFLP
jgi:rhamnulokinase